jgi:hypothetical protein
MPKMVSDFLSQARKRTAAAFAAGDLRRRERLASQLEQLAGEIRQGRHGEELLAAAERPVWMRWGTAR